MVAMNNKELKFKMPFKTASKKTNKQKKKKPASKNNKYLDVHLKKHIGNYKILLMKNKEVLHK